MRVSTHEDRLLLCVGAESTDPAECAQNAPHYLGKSSLRFTGLFLYNGVLLVSCFMWGGALDNSHVLQSYSIISLA